MSETHEHQPISLHRYANAGLLVGALGTIVTLAGMFGGNKVAWQAYLFGYIVWASLSLGCFGVLLLFHTVNGKWGLPVMRILEAGASKRNFGLLAALFIPFIVSIGRGDGYLYKWSDPAVKATDKVIQFKEPYLNLPFFLIRAALFFLLWMGLTGLLRRSTRKQDETGGMKETDRRSSWAAPGLVAFVLSITFAFTDWVMSLEPHWSSTIYGVWWVVGMALMAFAFVTIIATLNKDKAPYAGIVKPSWTRDMGNLLLTFTMLWGYTSLSQYLIIWSGNLGETISYYVQRSNNHWNAIGMATVLGQFFVPFFALLSPRVKAQSKLLAQICGWILVMRLLDMYYVVMPAMRDLPLPSFWDLVAIVGIGGLWTWAFSGAVKEAPLLPAYDPRLTEVEAHAH
ncbi:MAG: hypothetical protein BGO01_19900 [Armatimonadetes bacterium 55-13]|nr:hypothetical protein [Armatimonadota bacterium]OJU64377.1 MAG: hypothetical protein BGO01_19900 [Armatimonadetes bacterium 55-13]